MNSSPLATPSIEPEQGFGVGGAGTMLMRGGRLVRQAGAVLQHAAMLVVLLLSPSTYALARTRRAFALRTYAAATHGSAAFLLLSTCMSGVLTLVVVTAALGYGLSQYALEGIVRVLLLELIPLLAALFVLVEVTLPSAALLSMRCSNRGVLEEAKPGREPDAALRRAALPHALAGLVAPLAFSVIASWIALALAYLTLYGSTPWALQDFARVLGKVFDPVVGVVWTLKMTAFSATVSLLPIAAGLAPAGEQRADPVDLTLTTLVRTGGLLLLVELLALLGIYA